MKCFGYRRNDADTLVELLEVTLEANPEDLRRLASFFIQCADAMEENPDWEHAHFSDYESHDTDKVEIIVYADQGSD